MSLLIALIVLSHAVAAIAALAATRRLRLAAVIGSIPLVATLAWAGVALATESITDGGVIAGSFSWIPSLDVSMDVRVDALSVIFLTLIAGAGLAIVVFSAGYMRKATAPSRFIALLVLFAGAMSGLVIVDNVFGLFVFWELTTITSYLLIGHDDEKGSARAAALQAVLTTGLGGLALLGGLVLLVQETGTASLSGIVAASPDGGTVTAALVLVLVGALSKSAQFPFHFWLPGAMAAPTPASAYLHSATMVKAGIFLLIRLSPAFAANEIWTPVVVGAGLITMALGAWQAMRQTDLKLLLAHGTVSQLGFMTALTGFGSGAILHAAIATVIAHALFKSALFLTVGTVDAVAGTRDIRSLGGVGRRMPVLAAVGGIAAASMAGIIPLAGFVTKEAAVAALIDAAEWLTLGIVALASIFTVAYSARFWWGAFADKDHGPVELREPRPDLLTPTVALASLSVVFGFWPGGMAPLVDAVAAGGKLVLWPGFNAALGVSAGIVVLGGLAHLGRDRIAGFQQTFSNDVARVWQFSGEGAYRGSITGLNRTADTVTGVVQNGSLPVYLVVILGVTVSAPIVAWFASGRSSAGDISFAFTPAEVVLALLIGAVALFITVATSRLGAVLLLGAVGYGVAGIFVVYGAPDLALTLLLVETITVALFAFVLTRLPRRFEVRRWRVASAIRIGIATAVGGFVSMAMVIGSAERSVSPVSDAYAELAPEASGTNVVNVILTDFRALDTLGEITVLVVAAIGVGALVAGLRRPDGDAG